MELRFSEEYGRMMHFIDNKFIEAEADKWYPVYDPGLGKEIAKVPSLSVDDVRKAIDSAASAFEKWSNVPIFDRLQYLVRLKILIEQRFEELAKILAQNVGKTIREGRAEVRRALEAVDAALGAPHLFMSARKVMNLAKVEPEIDMEMIREPLGVFAIISPFNFPVMIPMWVIPWALTLGDTIVIKPSSLDPIPITLLMNLFMEAGYPPGVINLVNGTGSASEELLKHPEIQGVYFVGSTPVGEKIYSVSCSHGKRAICQCGAKNPVVIMPDAALESTVENVISGFFDMCGQRCLAPGVLITVGEAYDKFINPILERVRKIRVGYQLLETTNMGPMVAAKERDRVAGMIQKAVDDGAKLLIDGREVKVEEKYKGGFYLGPTVLDEVEPGMEIEQEEIFGPVMPIVRVSNFDEAIEVANNRQYGNTGTIYTSSGKWFREFAKRVKAGNIAANMAVAQPQQYFPFPARKKSHYGTLTGQVAVVDFLTDMKVIMQRWW
ncbi:MAG: aldehyde dehydrogenase family protein [Candidatus Methanomethyliaceae archaeon]|nr:aldehyde dehydrogenase family protein [Candidatus Methanomethyliaceae archaeon]MDW7971157.1 aldehyde dehydrogenase family protein [Nitrososphaerota archaeon]